MQNYVTYIVARGMFFVPQAGRSRGCQEFLTHSSPKVYRPERAFYTAMRAIRMGSTEFVHGIAVIF